MNKSSFFRVLGDLGFDRMLTPGFIRVLYAIGMTIIIGNALALILGSVVGFSGIGVSINGFDDSEFLTSSQESVFEPTVASVLLSSVLYGAIAVAEIALLRVTLEVAVSLATTSAAWQRIQARTDRHPELMV